MKAKQINLKKLLVGLGMIGFSVGLSYADGSGTVHNFKDWAGHLIKFVSQAELFIQIISTLVGMWFVFSALQLFRKHHTQQGAQGEHVKHGAGHLILGVFLICLVPAIQMIQATLGSDMGDSSAETVFSVDQNALNQ